MKVLLIAYAFPPYPIVGAIRAQQLANAFLCAGHQVHVLTARLPQEKARIRLKEGSLTVETVPTWPHPSEFYRSIKRRFARGVVRTGEPVPRFASHEQWRPPDRVPAWKRYILSLLHVPDELQGFIPPAIWRGIRAFPGGADVIYTTAPPNSSHLVALFLARLGRARWIAEFRDPWIGNSAKLVRSQRHSSPADAMHRWLERRCLRGADHVVAVTEQAARSIASRMPATAPGPIVARNGIERVLEEPEAPGGEIFKILYAGGIASGRDPLPLLEAVSAVARTLSKPEKLLRVDFVGNCRYFRGIDLVERSRELGIGDLVFFTSRVPHAEARRLQERADLLLLFAQQQPAQVPHKLYEYLGAGRPILALADHEGESADMLRRVGGHFLVTERDGWNVGPALREALTAFQDGSRFREAGPDAAILEEWKVEQQMRHLLERTGLA